MILGRIRDMYSGSYSKIMKYNDTKSVIKKTDERKIKSLLKLYLYDVLAPKKCTHTYKLSKIEMDVDWKFFTMVLPSECSSFGPIRI